MMLLVVLQTGSYAEEQNIGAISPAGHFVFAAAGHYALAGLCERIRSGHKEIDGSLYVRKPSLGCNAFGIGIVGIVAAIERKGWINEDFSKSDFRADIAGAIFSAIVVQW